MNAPTVIIVLILAVIAVFAVKDYIRRLAGGCCGGGGDAVKKRRVSDRDPSHYPYCAELAIEGMTCQNCVRRVENSLNELDGVWATVDLKSARATVRMKMERSPQELASAVQRAGYRVRSAPIRI